MKQSKEKMELIRKLKSENEDQLKIIYETMFIFALMWSFGAVLPEDGKVKFSNSLKSNVKNIKFPDSKDLCFQFHYDMLEGKWVNWSQSVNQYKYTEGELFESIVVPTTETVKNKFLLDLHINRGKPILFVGTAGTAKTTYIKDYFREVDKEKIRTASINFNSYTDSLSLQQIMESNVDKRFGKNYGPPPNTQLIYFMDDLNMPRVDKYGTQSPIALLRQIIDFNGLLYNRQALEEKKYLVDCLFTGCMNPKSGSFYVDSRLQRHYTVVACDVPTDDVLNTIFYQILDAHLARFDPICAKYTEKFIKATTTLFKKMVKDPTLRPTAKKFHYQFNLRDFSKIIKNLMLSNPNFYKAQPDKLGRLWVHECNRVYLDRLLFEKDVEIFQQSCKDGAKALELNTDELFKEPNIFTSFIAACRGQEKNYLEIEDIASLKKVLEDKL